MKPWYTSRTIWLGIITVLFAAGFIVRNPNVKPEDIMLVFTGLMTIFLRFDTQDPIK